MRYGAWPLALAAYKAGERRVDRAIARARRADFWQLADRRLLPRVSREYVPHFLALLRVTALGSSSDVACGEIAMKRAGDALSVDSPSSSGVASAFLPSGVRLQVGQPREDLRWLTTR